MRVRELVTTTLHREEGLLYLPPITHWKLRCSMLHVHSASYDNSIALSRNGRLRHGTRNTWHGFSVESRGAFEVQGFSVFPRPKQTKKIRDDPETLSVRALTLRVALAPKPPANPTPTRFPFAVRHHHPRPPLAYRCVTHSFFLSLSLILNTLSRLADHRIAHRR